jgi:formamidopyrimidine-DNA glycosylase
MAGWVQVKGVKTHFIVMENGGDKKANARNAQLKDQGVAGEDIGIEQDPDQVWPPKFYKFILKCDDGTEVAFTDARRLGRVRLIDAADDGALMKQEPLVRNGLDFSKPEQRWDATKFKSEVSRRRVPIKSLMMDQALFAGVGNWIADEILYQARVHPEESSDKLDESQLEALYEKLVSICNFVVQVEGMSLY